MKPHVIRDMDTGEVFNFDRIELAIWLHGEDCARRSNLIWENAETGNTHQIRRRDKLAPTRGVPWPPEEAP